MLKDSNASVKQSKIILQLASLLKLLLLEKTWERFSKNLIGSLEFCLGLQTIWIYGLSGESVQ